LKGSLARLVQRREQLFAWSLVAVGLVCIAVWLLVTSQVARFPGDTHNYILAGLRLNAGHPLYGYGPGDVRAPYVGGADYPLFSPPLIAVIFRPIVLLPANGEYVWWAAMDICEILAVAALVRRAPLVMGVALIPLSLAIAMAMWQGNVDCLVVAALVLAWCWLVQRQDDRAALLLALVASLKLTPVIFVWWLFVTGRRRAAAIAIGCGIVLALVAILGSEPFIFLRFYQVTVANLSAPSGLMTTSGLANAVGLPAVVVAWLPRALLVAGAAVIWVFRDRAGLSWAISALLMWIVSHVASLHTPALLLVALAPVAWPIASRRNGGREASPGGSAGELVDARGQTSQFEVALVKHVRH